MLYDCDFCGWATKNDIRCGDGRIIKKNAFRVNDGDKVPLVWNHDHDDPEKVLGHAILENRPEGVYAYCKFNNNKKALAAKESLKSGDIKSLSIWANELVQNGPAVEHGVIREVSLVLAGMNNGARIESVFAHGCTMDEDDEEGIFFMDEPLFLEHKEEGGSKIEMDEKDESVSVGDVLKTLTEEQMKAVAIMINQMMNDEDEDEAADQDDDVENEEEGDDDMKHNIFETKDERQENGDSLYLSHSQMSEIIENAKRNGSFKESLQEYLGDNGVLVHSIDTTGMTVATGTQTYGFNDPNMLFPDYKSLSTTPEWISRNMDWVKKLMSKVGRTPFSRIKSVFANITEDEARAKGYIKGKQKKEEVFSTLKRTTSPQTVYKKQKLDRDDVVDITDIDIIAWIRSEMRVMLDEEIARAVLLGDGRQADSDDKILETNVRPIVNDVPLFNTKVKVSVAATATKSEIADTTIDEIIRARANYKGTGNPDFYTTQSVITDMLLIKDKNGHRIYKSIQELSTALMVNEIIPVEPMEGMKVDIDGTKYPLIGIVVNVADYRIGADKGGQINNFEDFDIDFNQMKYLIETRISGALVKPFSAITIGLDKATPAG